MVFFCCLLAVLVIVTPTLWWWHLATCFLGYRFARHMMKHYFLLSGQLGILPEQGTLIVSAEQQRWQGQLKSVRLYFHCSLLLTVQTDKGTRHIGIMRHAMQEEYWRQLCRQVFLMV
ncbi:protein YgfX [Pseudoalteromonas rubra]|uniref:protein YgfX n=1 Tax=Pseudoalteromonas rubra TaxID=43658 RepID=UPI002DB5C8E0|nr:protein YgfX [Pseudoalteromonas rubra]MEC4087427.1 protein YgfX [Pseudoalteromonas rubra]